MRSITLNGKSSGNKAYRVAPDPDDPIILQIDDTLCHVLEISAMGCNIGIDEVAAGRRYPFSIHLPTTSRPISGYMDVISESHDEEDLGCRFVNLSAEEQDALHHYVLIRQKQAIRMLRSGKAGRL